MKIELPRIAVRVVDGRLVPDDPFAQEQIAQLPTGRFIVEAHTEEAEDGVRRMYMAGINLLFQNVDGAGPGGKWPTPTHLRREILRGIGFAEPIKRIDGIKMDARSMGQGSMSYEELVIVTELTRTYCFDRWGFDPIQQWQDEQDAMKKARR